MCGVLLAKKKKGKKRMCVVCSTASVGLFVGDCMSPDGWYTALLNPFRFRCEIAGPLRDESPGLVSSANTAACGAANSRHAAVASMAMLLVGSCDCLYSLTLFSVCASRRCQCY